jgi:hypothetical protein
MPARLDDIAPNTARIIREMFNRPQPLSPEDETQFLYYCWTRLNIPPKEAQTALATGRYDALPLLNALRGTPNE